MLDRVSSLLLSPPQEERYNTQSAEAVHNRMGEEPWQR